MLHSVVFSDMCRCVMEVFYALTVYFCDYVIHLEIYTFLLLYISVPQATFVEFVISCKLYNSTE